MKRSKPEIARDGTKRWKNAKGQYHREDGPAIECADGGKHYYVNGQLHREDGPAMEWVDGSKFYYIGGQRHREDGPAVEWVSGRKDYYINGKKLTEDELMKRSKPETDKGGTKRWKNAKGQFHREDGPAVEWADSSKHYYINGQLHREDGPAVEWASGSKSYYINGQRHREDGPAIEYADGRKYYYIKGQRHRKDGPAIELANGNKHYYINGKNLTEDEFMKRSKPEVDSNVKNKHHKRDRVEKLAEFSIEKEAELMKETIAMAHNYVTSENLKRLEKLRHNLRSRTELNRAELKAIRDGIKQPHRLASKPVIKSEAYASNVAILFLMALVGLIIGLLV